jgi:hypothetical protein
VPASCPCAAAPLLAKSIRRATEQSAAVTVEAVLASQLPVRRAPSSQNGPASYVIEQSWIVTLRLEVCPTLPSSRARR